MSTPTQNLDLSPISSSIPSPTPTSTPSPITQTKIENDQEASIGEIIIYFVIRLVVILLGLYLAYKIVMWYIEPNILQTMCITDTNNCSSIEIYRWKNTFIAKETVSQVWFWYNGSSLYVWGQTTGTCDTGYVPASMFTLSLDSNKNFTIPSSFSSPTNVCIDSPDRIVEIYKIEKKSEKEMFYLYRDNPNKLNTIFTIVKSMYDNKIFSL